MALVTPDRATLKKLAAKFTKEELPFEEMCEDKDVTGAALRELVNHGKKFNLEKFEIPGKTCITDCTVLLIVWKDRRMMGLKVLWLRVIVKFKF